MIFRKMNSPVDTGRKLNVHKTFRRRPGRLLNVLSTFNLRPVSTGMRVCISGLEMFVFRKIWRILFSCNTLFEVRPFALLPTIILL